MKTAYMFGFKKKNPEDTGYLNVSDYSIEQDISRASPFSLETDGRKGWASPEKWLEFFNSEDELKDWKFHIIYREN